MILDHQSTGTANQGEKKANRGSAALLNQLCPWLILSAIFLLWVRPLMPGILAQP